MAGWSWAYDPKKCDGDYCPHDCDRCEKAYETEMRLIDANALSETMRRNAEGNEGWYGDTWAFMRDIDNAPTIDAVVVVNCINCERMEIQGKTSHFCFCKKWYSPVNPFGFCNFGKEQKDAK